ncbi:MAG: hypothetical protein GX455_17300 [Phycisphaerae bacterium]|nr:hypothetical protein [Phycisphaerae bacterium]
MRKTAGDIRIDCIKMKREIQGKVARRMRGMSPKERVAYLNERVRKGPFRDLLGK